ncbi:hypothetical protein P4O66_001245 [Electrophorus voltai]|uniref:Tripartite motif containing 25, like n=1 Tax=Electrophorus voltai TaxID=2609070 RepID=A0AAD8ZCN7_9TELE|nr:hypothetical protein P4O66_001245 [Electrophorus voltai]
MSGTGLWTEEQFNCPVCLDLPSEPVTIPCGHSYCMACIADYWKSEGQKGGAYSCPECRQTFKPCPQLCRNTMLAEAVEQLRRGNLSAAARESIRSASRAARSGSARAAARTSTPLPPSAVPCDRCTEPRAALKTCLVCMASLCETHLKPHQTKAKLKGHELIGPTGDLSQKICPHHKYLQEFHCRTCQKFVCWICTSNQHKGHETVSTQTERTEKQRSSDTVKAEADTVLLELQHSVQRLQQLIQDVMSSTGQEKLSEAQDMVDKLEAEIKQLKKKDTELKNLVSSEDNIYFLKSYEALCSPDLSLLGSVSVSVNADVSFEPVRSLIYELRERVEDMCNQELDKINKTVFSTTAFTVTDQQNGQKPAILKLFSGLGAKSSNNRTQGGSSIPTADLSPPALPSVSVRGTGPGSFAQDVRSRNDPRVDRRTNSPRPKATQGRVEREEESSPRPLQRPNLNTSDEQVNPGLFLDSPTEFTMTPAFPVLREIDMDSIEAPEPRTRDEFLQYACALTLDPNTAHQRLALMEEGTRAELQVRALPYPECPQRFDGWTQVLCLQPLVSERSYWEVEWRGRGSSLGVASAAMTRKGADARAGLGYNSQSWSMELSDMCCAAMHANQKKEIPVTYCPRVGVFLDRGAGTLSFYAVDDSLLLVHEFRGSFSEPLFAAFGVGSGVGVGLDFAMASAGWGEAETVEMNLFTEALQSPPPPPPKLLPLLP